MDDGALRDSVIRYYEDNPEVLQVLRAVLRGKVPGVSLRLLDYLVTNYSKAKNVSIRGPDGTTVYIYREYKAQLRGYSKKQLDPFARRGRVVVDFQGGPIETTIAQLNFFRWAISKGIVEYASEHAEEIESFYMSTRGTTNKKLAPDAPKPSTSPPQRPSHVLSFA